MVNNGHVSEWQSREAARKLSMDCTGITCRVYWMPAMSTHWIRFDTEPLTTTDSVRLFFVAAYLNGELVR